MRRLVVCADGTWKSRDDETDATNVQKICDLVLPVAGDGTTQLSEYFPGVGTTQAERLLGGAVGFGLSRNVKIAYRWLAENYGNSTDPDPGDELYLFGFSRGAYTVRSLAGMIRNVGLLRAEHLHRLDDAYSHYRNRDRAWAVDGACSVSFRERWSHDVPEIRCIGVWDTVGALGLPTRGPVGWFTRRRWGFHDVELSGRVRSAFHALAVDECRRAFAPTIWQADDAHAAQQHVEQVWFAGSHSDVGGGAADSRLSDATLLWMAGKARDCGLDLDEGRLKALAPDTAHGPLHESFTWPYWIQGRHERALCQETPFPPGRFLRTHQRLDESVLDRHSRCTAPPTGPYAPANLLRYMAQIPKQAGERAEAPHGVLSTRDRRSRGAESSTGSSA